MSSVSVVVTVPYNARKGQHIIGFPVQNRTNQVLSIMVYDPTPVIETVNPVSISAGIATTITITGTGFGNHPSVNIWVVNYNVTATHDAQGKDTVTMSVNISASQNGSVPLYLISNGFGQDLFTGAPQGQTRGSPISNTIQLQVPRVCDDVFISEETVSPSSLDPFFDSLAASPPQALRNPAAIRRGFAPVFEVTRSPANCAVLWSIVAGPGSITWIMHRLRAAVAADAVRVVSCVTTYQAIS